jgi:hypothetical protein
MEELNLSNQSMDISKNNYIKKCKVFFPHLPFSIPPLRIAIPNL